MKHELFSGFSFMGWGGQSLLERVLGGSMRPETINEHILYVFFLVERSRHPGMLFEQLAARCQNAVFSVVNPGRQLDLAPIICGSWGQHHQLIRFENPQTTTDRTMESLGAQWRSLRRPCSRVLPGVPLSSKACYFTATENNNVLILKKSVKGQFSIVMLNLRGYKLA